MSIGHCSFGTRRRPVVLAVVGLSLTVLSAHAQSTGAPTWKNGTTTFTFGHGELQLSNRVQIRWTDERDDEDEPADLTIRRARSKVEGWIGSRAVTYEFGLDYTGGGRVLDAWLNWDPFATEAFQVQVGQFKVPFGRERLTSSGKRQLVDRSAVSGDFTDGRDIGVQVWGLGASRRIEYRAGVFNGNGRGVLTNPDGHRQLNARIMVQPFGKVGYGESDFESTGRPLVAVAVNAELNDRRGASAENDLRRRLVGIDVAAKHRGASLVVELFHGRFEPEAGPTFTARGLLLQGGWFIVPTRVEVAARYGAVLPETTGFGFRREREAAVGGSYYLSAHRLKLQADVRRLHDVARGRTSYELRTQVQAAF